MTAEPEGLAWVASHNWSECETAIYEKGSSVRESDLMPFGRVSGSDMLKGCGFPI